MNHILLGFFIALTNNFDNIGARIAYSIRGISISTPINLWISVITFVISYFAAFSGKAVSGSLGTRVSSIIAMVILVDRLVDDPGANHKRATRKFFGKRLTQYRRDTHVAGKSRHG